MLENKNKSFMQMDGPPKIWFFSGNKPILFKWRETCIYLVSYWKNFKPTCATASQTRVYKMKTDQSSSPPQHLFQVIQSKMTKKQI